MNKMTERENNIVVLPSTVDIEAEAASWLVVLGRENVAQSDVDKLNQWLERSAKHRNIFAQLSALSGDLSILNELQDIEISTPNETRNVQTKFSRRGALAVAASIFGLAFAGTAGRSFYLHHFRLAAFKKQYVTAVGEQLNIKLLDGSEIKLNTDSQVAIDFSKNVRMIHLVKGEAYFSVAKDKKRPFLVYAAEGVVRAVGTAFTVRLGLHDAVEVTVDEGRVELVSLKKPTATSARVPTQMARVSIAELTAGQNAVFTKRMESIAQIPRAELDRKLSWRQGLLAYSGETLRYVVDDISRYTDVQIEITDPALGDILIGGYFKIGEIEALFDSLEQTFGLRVEHVDEKHVKLWAL